MTFKTTMIAMTVIAIIAALAWALLDPTWLLTNKQARNDRLIEEQMAHHAGFLAYLYGYPLVAMAQQMHNETHRVAPDQQVLAPLNRFYRFPGLVTPETAGNLRAPNADTLYFSAWYDVSAEPLLIHVPDTAGRYYTLAVTNQYAEVQHLGRRTTGSAEALFALVFEGTGPELPKDVRKVVVDTPRGWILGRMGVDGPDDLAEAEALVHQIWSAPLSEAINGRPATRPEPPAADPMAVLESLDYFQVLNRVIKTLPPRPDETALLAQFDQVGFGPSQQFDVSRLTEATRKGLQRAIEDGRKVVEAATFRSMDAVNGWITNTDLGRYGHQFMHRASVVKGGFANLPEESLYPAALLDSQGRMLHGRHTYRLQFEPGALPPVDGFWSLSVYNLDARLEPNRLQRYSIGQRTSGLKYSEDGSLTLWLAHEPPEAGEANWLPAPKGHYFAVMRLYEPRPDLLEGRYHLPPLERVEH